MAFVDTKLAAGLTAGLGGADGASLQAPRSMVFEPWARDVDALLPQDALFTDKRYADTGADLMGPGGPLEQGVTDTVPAGTGTTFTLAVGGVQNGVVNTGGDSDWYRVELVAGETYMFTATGATVAGSGPVEDPYLDLFNANGQLIATDDDFGPGRDAALRYTVTQSGTYYIGVRAWESDAPPYENLTGGYQVGLTAGHAPQNPLDAIDMGFEVGVTTIEVYFATAGQTFSDDTAVRSWAQYEINAAMAALQTYADIANLNFVQVGSTVGADFILTLAELEGNVLGHFSTQGGVGYGAFDPEAYGWNAGGLAQGGAGFATLLHEFGHGLGLAHPHDNSGANNNVSSEVMQGVLEAFGSYGDFNLNQGVFTIMTYNDAYETGVGYPPGSNYGSQGTPGTLDIALIQEKYDARPHNTGDDVYTVPGGVLGGMFAAIWDTGGTDSIVYGGTRNVTIDLRAATLLNAFGGGGYVSNASGIYGGFTIAHGVMIENAQGGSGNDTINGNDGDNQLLGGLGDDIIGGFGGNDALDGGDGFDQLDYRGRSIGVFAQLEWGYAYDPSSTGTVVNFEWVYGSDYNDVLIGNALSRDIRAGAGADWVEDVAGILSYYFGGAGNDVIFGGGGDDGLYGEDGDDALLGGLGADSLEGGGGVDWIYGGAANDTISGSFGDDVLFGGEGGGSGDANDRIYGGEGVDALIGEDGDDYLNGEYGDDWAYGGAGNDSLWGFDGNDVLAGEDGDDEISGLEGNDFVFGGYGNDQLNGGAGNDWIDGSYGIDTIYGGAGADSLFGGQFDRFVYYSTSESTEAAADVIGAFYRPSIIDVSNIDANGEADGMPDFVFVSAPTGVAGQAVISYNSAENYSVARFYTNADFDPDMAIVVLGVELTPEDFLL